MNHFMHYKLLSNVFWLYLNKTVIFSNDGIFLSWGAFIFYSLGILFLIIIILKSIYKKKLYFDDLTELPNEKAFRSEYANFIKTAKLENTPISIILMDVDNFKNLNTIYGQDVADNVLKEIGKILKSDNRATDRVYRQHTKGDEFLIVAKETSIVSAEKAANRKRELISKMKIPNLDSEKITVSCGVSQLDLSDDDDISLMKRVGEAMQKAKTNGHKNTTFRL